MIPNSLNAIVSYVPVSSDTIKTVSIFSAGVAATSLFSDYTSMLGWGAALLAFALAAIKRIKRHQEEKLQREQDSKEFCTKMHTWLAECIQSTKNPYSNQVREEMLEVLNGIRHRNVYIQQGSDDFRSKFVGFQNAMEYVIAAQKILSIVHTIVGAIHTPLPATPLCTPIDGRLVEDLTAPSLRHDSDKLKTVAERAVSIRCMLAQIGTLLYAVYPRGGLEAKTRGTGSLFRGSGGV